MAARRFGELVRRFEGAVYGTALRQMGDPLEAEELVQEVFLRAFEKLPQLRDPAAFGGWLRAMTRRMAINRMLRRPVAVATAPEVLEATCADANSPLDQVLASERSAEVQRWPRPALRHGPADSGGVLYARRIARSR